MQKETGAANCEAPKESKETGGQMPSSGYVVQVYYFSELFVFFENLPKTYS